MPTLLTKEILKQALADYVYAQENPDLDLPYSMSMGLCYYIKENFGTFQIYYDPYFLSFEPSITTGAMYWYPPGRNGLEHRISLLKHILWDLTTLTKEHVIQALHDYENPTEADPLHLMLGLCNYWSRRFNINIYGNKFFHTFKPPRTMYNAILWFPKGSLPERALILKEILKSMQ